jgi:hypothetical protein
MIHLNLQNDVLTMEKRNDISFWKNMGLDPVRGPHHNNEQHGWMLLILIPILMDATDSYSNSDGCY